MSKADALLVNLHPLMRPKVEALSFVLLSGFRTGATKTDFRFFEGYRSPDRQSEVYGDGHSKARAWQSAHQYGLAADFVAYRDDAWSWDADEDWDYLARSARALGLLTPIKWDRPHIEHPAWITLKRTLRGGK